MNTTKELFDLTDKEMEIYKFLLKNPDKNAVDIASEIGMQRPNVYDLIKSLLSKGLLSYNLKGKVKSYLAVNPEKLRDIYEFKKEILNEKKNEVEDLVKSLSNSLINSNSEINIKTYEGLKGMRTVLMEALQETLNSKKEMLALRLNKENLPQLDKTYTERFFNFRRKHNIKSRYLMLKGTQFYQDSLVKIKTLPDNYSSRVGIYIYGNSVSFWFFPKKQTILVIENQELADTFRNHFNIIWDLC